MSPSALDLKHARAGIHRETGRDDRLMLPIHEDTADRVRFVRDQINEAAGEHVVTTDDIVRMAFYGLGAMSELSQNPEADLPLVDDYVLPLGDVVHDATEPADWFPEAALKGTGDGGDSQE